MDRLLKAMVGSLFFYQEQMFAKVIVLTSIYLMEFE